MIPIKKHVEALLEYDKKLKDLSNQIDERRKVVGDVKFDEELYGLTGKYIRAIRVWEKIDDVIEFHVLNAFEEE